MRYHGGCYNCGEYTHHQSRCRYDHRIKCGYSHSCGHRSRLYHYNSAQVQGEEDTAVEQAKQKDCLVIEHINARSLLATISEIRLLAINRNIDILCISETWLLPHTPDSYIHIRDYGVYRCDKNHGGGVCVYVKNCLATNVITSNADSPNGVEDVWLSNQCRKNTFYYCRECLPSS